MGLTDEGMCFACGPKNPIGLKLQFHFDGDEYVTLLVTTTSHQGYDGVVHGGIISTILDEVMARGLWVRGIHALTTQLHVTLRKAARVGERLEFRGRIEEEKTRKILCTATARNEMGILVAEGSAEFIRVRDARKE